MSLVEAARDLDGRLDERVWGSAADFWAYTSRGWNLLLSTNDHPCDALQQAWDDGVRAGGAQCLGLVVEGWRHLTAEEIEHENPDFYLQLFQEAQEKGGDEVENVDDLVTDSWAAACASMPVLTMPLTLRTQVRNCAVIDKDGSQVFVIRDRDGDISLLPTIPPERIRESRVPDYMHMFLNGRRPSE